MINSSDGRVHWVSTEFLLSRINQNMEQTSWMLFLKYFDALKHEKSLEAELLGDKYQYIIDQKHRWGTCATPKDADGNFDHNNALTGDDLIEYVDVELFPYLKAFKQRAESPNTIEYKIGEIFDEIKIKFKDTQHRFSDYTAIFKFKICK